MYHLRLCIIASKNNGAGCRNRTGALRLGSASSTTKPIPQFHLDFSVYYGSIPDMKRNIIQFSISKGEKKYIAHAVDFPIFTQAKTLDELVKNIKEATKLHFSDSDLKQNGLSKEPSLFVNFEIPQYA